MWTETTKRRLLDLADPTTPDVGPLDFDEPRMEFVRVDPAALGPDPQDELALIEEAWEFDPSGVG